MASLNDHLKVYRQQLEDGAIKAAYRGLMKCISDLKNCIQQEYPRYKVAGHIHQGTMDITFFAFTTEVLKMEKLKIVILFNHEAFRFEAWLCGQNKQVQQKYWEIFSGSDWNKYTISKDAKDGYSIVEYVLDDNANFGDLDALQERLSEQISHFVSDLETVFE